MVKNLLLLLFLLAFVLLVNSPIIAFDMMYPEQPLIYLANQGLHSFKALLDIYLHPKMFHLSILFFRPSGHFLIYQILEPLLGWHNTRGLLIINLSFLALTGFFLIKLYNLLFPGFKLGGYLAFSLYLMHPALMLSRLISLHFEFAYVFFAVLSLYYFLRFCETRRSLLLFAASLFFYAIAITFKEPSLILGPVLISYFIIASYHGQPLLKYFGSFIQDKQNKEVLLILVLTTFCLGLYLSMQWPALIHPLHREFHLSAVLAAAFKFFSLIAGFESATFPHPAWRNVLIPLPTTLLLGGFLMLSLAASRLLFANKKGQEGAKILVYQKALSFLWLSSFLFLLLPIFWGWGLPWHLNLSLIFLSLIMGFSGEYLTVRFVKARVKMKLLLEGMAFLIGLTAIMVNETNIAYLKKEQGFALAVGRNAVMYPPALKLNAKTVVVVEDSILQDSYLLGASIYPYVSVVMNNPNLDANKEQFEQLTTTLYIKQQPVYNGTLFRWAYLMPTLQEEVVPFHVEQLAEVPDPVFYDWLHHFDNIVCLGYDNQANWHDRTALFKKNLLIEKEKRAHFASVQQEG